MELAPRNEYQHDLALHPPEWENPTPRGRYNLVVVGGGTAGIISALTTADLRGSVALVESRLLGGDTLNFGCVPSKAVLRAARAAYEAAHLDRFGLSADRPVSVDFPRVMARMRRLRSSLGRRDSAWRFTGCGADVFLGNARFTGRNSLEVNGQTLQFQRAIIATGSRPQPLTIPGLDEAGYHTSESIFSLNQLPRRLIVIGNGPIGCELAQAFRRFGSEVHLLGEGSGLLLKEDRAAADVVQRQFEREGIRLYSGWSVLEIEKAGHAKSLVIQRRGEKQKLFADEILVAIGREPNVEGLDLEAAGVEFGPDGIAVDDYLQTANPAIFAAGDVCSRHRFTHAAEAMGRLAVGNALFRGRKRASRLVIPRCTYTDPEVAHVGLTPAEADEQALAIDSYRVDLSSIDRAVLDHEDEGFAVVHTRRGTGRVVGATVVAAHAGEMIGEISLLMTHKISLGSLASTIHCYPTQAEVFKRIGDAYQRQRPKPRVRRLVEKWLAWQRREPQSPRIQRVEPHSDEPQRDELQREHADASVTPV
jgi:pyruvate/2-oxoglutarate dehydrogenase complex dihydrolipoamide dehydrogenase (E3) component